MSRKSVCVIGGGASGLMAALQAYKNGSLVTLFEKNDRVGKKILATGNGRCNFTNASMSKDYYYADDDSFVGTILDKFSNNDLCFFFKELGLLIKEKNGYYYPYSENASSVLDVFRNAIGESDIKVYTESFVTGISVEKNRFKVSLDNGNNYSFDKVILSTGGKAGLSPKDQCNSYSLLKGLKLNITPVFPALTQIRCSGLNFKALAGVRSDCVITVLKNNEEYFKQAGEVLFADYGISGIVTFQVSHCVGDLLNNNDDTKLILDLIPQVHESSLIQFLLQKKLLHPDTYLEHFLTGIHNKKSNNEVIKISGFSVKDIVSNLSNRDLARIINIYKNFECIPTGLNGFDKAQVTAGGLDTGEVNDCLEVKKIPGLYITGEILNVDGLCGGYNLQWAFSTGAIAGIDASKGNLYDNY